MGDVTGGSGVVDGALPGEPPREDDLREDTELRTGRVVDQVSTEQGTVVMVGLGPSFHVVRLSPLGAEVLRLVTPGTTLARLARELRESLGEPPSGDLVELVRAAVLDLARQRVIVAGQRPKRGIADISTD
ncbi:hypothetical protein [Terrabacter sp. NPDC080008]|uniref:hypothetical protein n=1 Tax=Terrabacter sp. NPDC080008 TaxID=3155176 RepID=UPI003450A273